MINAIFYYKLFLEISIGIREYPNWLKTIFLIEDENFIFNR